MEVKVRGVGLTRQLLGQAEVAVSVPEGTTVAGLLDRLAEQKGEVFARYTRDCDEPSKYAPLRIVVNGRDLVSQQVAQTMLAEGDDVLVLLPIAGG